VEMQRVLETVRKVAATDANVLILGENGTGKELIARAIHMASVRKDDVFISVDLGAITESLFESELFGFKKGAFTDAKEDRAGRFEAANKGTIFLDEIGNLSLSLQSKLLSVLQSRNVVRLGTNKEIPIDVRLVCATNMPLTQMVAEGTFREDLLYRINTISLELPPLRKRLDDISGLASFFLKHFAAKYNKENMSICSKAIDKLKTQSWQGNIRELQHAIEKAVILSDSQIIQEYDFCFSGSERPVLKDDCFNLIDHERLLIDKAISNCKGNMSKAAKKLGINRSTLYDKIKKYDL